MSIAISGVTVDTNGGATASHLGYTPANFTTWTAGDLVFVGLDLRNADVITDPAGWTLVDTSTRSTNLRLSLWWRVMQAGDATPSFAWATTDARVIITSFVVAGANNTTPIDNHAVANGASTSSVPLPSIDPVGTATYQLGWWANLSTGATWTVPGTSPTWAELSDSQITSMSGMLAGRQLANGNLITGSAETATPTVASAYASMTVTLAPATGGSPQTINAAVIASGSSLSGPRVDLTLTAAMVNSGSQLFGAQVDLTVNAAAISAGSQLFGPRADVTLNAAVIAGASQLFGSRLDVSLNAAVIASGSVLYGGDLSLASGDQTIDAAVIPSGALLPGARVDVTLNAAAIASGSALYGGSVSLGSSVETVGVLYTTLQTANKSKTTLASANRSGTTLATANKSKTTLD